LPFLLIILFVAPMLSGCYYHHRDDWNGRGHGHGERYRGDRGPDGYREGYRDYRR
jgi:hypothetical protein